MSLTHSFPFQFSLLVPRDGFMFDVLRSPSNKSWTMSSAVSVHHAITPTFPKMALKFYLSSFLGLIAIRGAVFAQSTNTALTPILADLCVSRASLIPRRKLILYNNSAVPYLFCSRARFPTPGVHHTKTKKMEQTGTGPPRNRLSNPLVDLPQLVPRMSLMPSRSWP